MNQMFVDTAAAAEELRRRNREATALYEIGRQLAASFDVDTILSLIVKNTRWLLEAHFAGVALYDGAEPSWTWRMATGETREGMLLDRLVERNVLAKVLERQMPVQTGLDTTAGGASSPFLSALAVPLAWKGELMGVLVAAHRIPYVYSEDEQRLLLNIASQAAVTLDNARLYQATAENAEQLKALSSRLAGVQEEERSRLSRELHDGIGQALTAVRLHLDLLQKEAPITGEKARETLDGIYAILDETLQEIRQIAFDLRPAVLDDVGLAAAVRIFIERFQRRTGITVELVCPQDRGVRSPVAEGTLFRVLQESLTNVAKHAGAKHVNVSLSRSGEYLVLSVKDDGEGFEIARGRDRSPRGGIGILGMRERVEEVGGEFFIESKHHLGTALVAKVPLTP